MKQGLHKKKVNLFLRLLKCSTLIIVCIILLYANSFAQNSFVGDGYGGRLWYQPVNYTVGSYSGYTVCGSNKQLYGWGDNSRYELGNNSSAGTTAPVAILSDVERYSCGYIMGAIKTDKTGWVWGDMFASGDFAANNLGHTPQQVITNAKVVDAGVETVLFTKYDGTVWSVGNNADGEFGNGTTSNTTTLTPIQMSGITTAVRAVAGGYLGGSNPYAPSFSVILLSNGTVMQCGKAGTILGSDTYTPAVLSGLSNVVDIKANSVAAYALTSNGNVYSWGYNFGYALGTSAAYNAQVTTPTQVVFPNGTASIVALSTTNDGQTVFALDANNNAWAWGDGTVGQAGTGTTGDYQTPQLVATGVKDILAAETFTYIIKTDGTIWATGQSGWNNTYGSIWMNLSNVQRTSFTQVDPIIAPMTLCNPSPFGLLAVKLEHFSAIVQNNNALIQWSVSEERDLSHYEIEFSINGINFKTIGTESAAGKSNYTFVYTATVVGANYYRLKSVDVNGKVAYSEVAVLKFGGNSNSLSIYPNPVINSVNMSIAGNLIGKSATISLRSMDGRLILRMNKNALGQVENINVSNIAVGKYIVTVNSNEGVLNSGIQVVH